MQDSYVRQSIPSNKLQNHTYINKFKMVMHYFFITGVCALLTKANCDDKSYVVPIPVIEVNNDGFKVSIKHEEGITLVYFSGTILTKTKNVKIVMTTYNKTDDVWSLKSDYNNFKKGSIINYWLYVKKDGEGYRLLPQIYEVQEDVDTTTEEYPKAVHDNSFSYNDDKNCFDKVQTLKNRLAKLQQKINFLDDVISDTPKLVKAFAQNSSLTYLDSYAVY
ncbi:hypothetical protein FQR65_LT01682 [Abscondita terminalis]|nr:hypothetical protein FQR65_LT01682 [Abscondita terminalis]